MILSRQYSLAVKILLSTREAVHTTRQKNVTMAAATTQTNQAVAWGGMTVGGIMYKPFFGEGDGAEFC